MDKVVLVGAGNVGMSYAYSLINANLHIDEFVIIDLNKEKAEGEALDLTHAVSALNKHTIIKSGGYEECDNATIVCICAGRNQEVGETRIDLISKNYAVFKSVIGEINKTKFKGIYLIATNPLDVMTQITQELSGFPKERVIGSGTTLDTARLRSLLSKETNVSPKSIHAYVIGEHGDSEFIPWSNTIIGLNKVTESISKATRSKIQDDVRNSAYDIINKKGNTCYGIGVCLMNITKAILENANSVFTVSCYDKRNGIYIGLPAVVGKKGISKIFYLDLNKEEEKQFANSVECIKTAMASIKK